MIRIRVDFFLLIGILSMYSCTSTSDHNKREAFNSLDTISNDTIHFLKPYSNSIPAPVEFISSLYDFNLPYQGEILHNPSLYENYLSSYKKALNIGVYGADLCYLSMYKKNKVMPPYFDAIRNLMIELRVDHVISFDKYKDFAQNPNDSVLNLLSMDLERINTVLLKRNQSNLSWLVAFGGWIESLYFSTNIQNIDNLELQEKLAEQKIVFEAFVAMMVDYKNEAGFSELSAQIKPLSLIFDQVQVNYTTEENASSHEENDILVFNDVSTSSFVISKEKYKELQKEIKAIRSHIIR